MHKVERNHPQCLDYSGGRWAHLESGKWGRRRLQAYSGDPQYTDRYSRTRQPEWNPSTVNSCDDEIGKYGQPEKYTIFAC